MKKSKGVPIVVVSALCAVSVFTASSSYATTDVPVTYTVDSKALKAAGAGTMVTFELFSDAGCGSSVASVTVPIEATDLISGLKILTPKNSMKLPKSADIRYTM